MRLRQIKRVVKVAAGVGVGGVIVLYSYPRVRYWLENNANQVTPTVLAEEASKKVLNAPMPSRDSLLAALQKGEEYDMLVIGGGATGCGVALDGVSRGLKVALVEKFDFSSGTSSRSTKLIHGGVRYLQKAIMQFDIEQYRMVKEALAERANLITIAPHLAYPLPIMIPVYKYWQLPYYWFGIKMYDIVAGRQCLKSSYAIGKQRALELFPMLKGDKLKGAIVYYDGQQDDARMCLVLALTSAKLGAHVANHVEVVGLLKKTNEKGDEVVCGAKLKERFTGKQWEVKAKCVINATGPYTDTIRKFDDPTIKDICQPSSGIHIILPEYYSPADMGLLDPQTSDGRVIFFLPWQRLTMAGTTDIPCSISDNPSPTEAEIQFILKEIRNYLSPDVNVRRGDVLSAWAGIRPLVVNPNAKDTQSIARNHIIEVSKSNMVTIAGGKWTTYRHMAEETVDKAIEVCKLKPANGCVTTGLLLDGAHGYTPTLFIRLIQDFGLDTNVAKHLASTYGDRAFKVARMAQLTGKRWPVVGNKLHEDFSYIEAEVYQAVREYACTAIDVLARRTRLAFLNVNAAQQALPMVIDILAKELAWSKDRRKEETERAERFLRLEMGLNLKDESQRVPVNFTADEINTYVKRFRKLDYGNKGYVTANDLRDHFKKMGEHVSGHQLSEMLSEVDINRNGQIELGEYLQLMSALKTGVITSSRFAKATDLDMQKIDTARSGGGV